MKVKVNKKAPSVKLLGTNNLNFELKNFKNKILVYFYPKDDTPGCTIETKDFSKLYKKFKEYEHSRDWIIYHSQELHHHHTQFCVSSYEY